MHFGNSKGECATVIAGHGNMNRSIFVCENVFDVTNRHKVRAGNIFLNFTCGRGNTRVIASVVINIQCEWRMECVDEMFTA